MRIKLTSSLGLTGAFERVNRPKPRPKRPRTPKKPKPTKPLESYSLTRQGAPNDNN
jgi:hypothetical protein